MRIEHVQGDITKLRVDVIVNATNETLLGGSGVDGAIAAHTGALPELVILCTFDDETTEVTRSLLAAMLAY